MSLDGSKPWGLHWFRRDLRVAGNPSLRWSCQKFQGRVLGIFCFDAKFLGRADFSADRFQFFLETLAELAQELEDVGSSLLVLDVAPREAFPRLFAKLAAAGTPLPQMVSWNRDYEPFARQRDGEMERYLTSVGLESHIERDHLLIEPEEIQTQTGSPFQIYTPFAKQWLTALEKPMVKARLAAQQNGLHYLEQKKRETIFQLSWSKMFAAGEALPCALQSYRQSNAAKVTVPIPKAGSRRAFQKLLDFQERLGAYERTRDLPAIDGTSQLSIFLKNGSLTTAQIIAQLGLAAPTQPDPKFASKYLCELIWREFYYHILYHHPNVEHEAYIEKYRRLEWENDPRLFAAWKEGMTGFPLVDAGMRQLAQTGWMHNRVRMIVASFLTKDLLIDWRWGERYFMEKLLDGDLAPNNGGWQWAASTGCDPQPYFRVFNPELQSEKFDPTGAYIKRWVPELAHVPPAQIHAPPAQLRRGYPAPIVDHRVQRNRAIMLYKR